MSTAPSHCIARPAIALVGRFFALILLAPWLAPAFALSDPPRDVSSLVAPLLEQHQVPALVAVVTDRDGPVATAAAGVRRRGDETAVTIDDRFHIGSDTKAMTATLMATLVEDGTLSWSMTLGESFPALADDMHADWKPVALELLLYNRAGAPADLDAGGLWRRLMNHKGTPLEQRTDLADGVLARPPAATPGTQFIYSNAGFAIAGHAAEIRTGIAWEDLMRRRLFEPLGMRSAGFGSPGSKDSLDQPRGHRADGSPVEPGKDGWRGSDNTPAIGPAGTVHCSIIDWAKFAAMHLRAGRSAEGRAPAPTLLKPETFEKLHRPFASSDSHEYAMGWGVTTRPWAKGPGPGDTGSVLTHAGSNTMWFAVAWLAPERGFAVLVACNQGGDAAQKACDQAAAALIKDHLAHIDASTPHSPK